MKKFLHRFRVAAPLEAVALFHANPLALKTLTPPPFRVQLQEVEPLAENSRVRFTLWFGPIPIPWEAVHTNVSEKGFTDTQTSGPYQSWVHQHQFVQIEPGLTEVRDEVSATYGSGLFKGLTTRLLWVGMPVLFAYRARKTTRSIEGHS